MFFCSALLDSPEFDFMPLTAGARILSVDGGGVRAIIQLKVLQHLESRLFTPILHHFSYIYGSGKSGEVKLWDARRLNV